MRETTATLQTAIARIVQDGSYDDSTILRFINLVRNTIAGRVKLPALRSVSTLTTVVGANQIPMPDDFQQELFNCFDVTNSRRVKDYPSMNLLLRDHPYDYNEDGALHACVVEAATPQVSKGTITLAGLPVADETFTIGDQTFTFKTSRVSAYEVTIGATAAATATNIASAINSDLAATYPAAASSATVVVSSVAMTAAANDEVFSVSATNITMDGSGYMGGTQQGVKTAWLKYHRSPTAATTLRVHYFAYPTALSAVTDSPTELPEHLQYDLIVRGAVYEIFEEIYSEDNPQVATRWLQRFEGKVRELELFLGPYVREPVVPEDTMEWSDL